MKRLVLVVALMGLSGCGVMRDGGTALCSAQDKVAAGLVTAGNSVGFFGLGPIFVDLVNTGLEFGCTVFDAVVSAPADVGAELGLPPIGEADAEEPGAL